MNRLGSAARSNPNRGGGDRHAHPRERQAARALPCARALERKALA